MFVLKKIAAVAAGLVAALWLGLSASAETVEITRDGQQTDQLAGVPALYVTYPSNTGEYCCAGYVMRFYRELFGLTVTDINTVEGPPVFSLPGHTVTLEETETPRRFDLAQTRQRSHVAVVKDPAPDGAVVIEQNYKYYDNDGRLVTERDRVANGEEYVFYRILIDGRPLSPAPESGSLRRSLDCGMKVILRAVRALLAALHPASGPPC